MNTWFRESKTKMRMKMNGWTIDESIDEVSTSKKFYIKGKNCNDHSKSINCIRWTILIGYYRLLIGYNWLK